MTTADEYNAQRLASGELTTAHISELTRFWQREHGLVPDGKAGPLTIQALDTRVSGIVDGWLQGDDVLRISADTSWYGATLSGGRPGGIVAHYTATDPGTAINMAKRRAHKFGSDPDDRLASWHITIETDGSMVQMIPFTSVAWHAGSDTAQPVPGLGYANQVTVGVELVGYGDKFTDAQVESAKRLWRALVRTYGIRRKFAMVTHQSIDPTRRNDPGPLWVEKYAPAVLEYAYA